MYISGGSNVYPREIEEKLLTHPAVAEAASSACPTRLGRGGRGGLRAADRRELDERDCWPGWRGKVARYKLPKRVFFWDALPKSGYGKITKKIVRQELEARGCLPLDKPREASA